MKTKEGKSKTKTPKRAKRFRERDQQITWNRDFHSQFSTSIAEVVRDALGEDPKLLCTQTALIAKELSNGRLDITSGFLIVEDGEEKPLSLTHVWNQDKFGNIIDLSEWSNIGFPYMYVTEDNRDMFNFQRSQFPGSDDFFSFLPTFESEFAEASIELSHAVRVVEQVGFENVLFQHA